MDGGSEKVVLAGCRRGIYSCPYARPKDERLMKWCFEMMAGSDWISCWCCSQATSRWGVWSKIATAATSGG